MAKKKPARKKSARRKPTAKKAATGQPKTQRKKATRKKAVRRRIIIPKKAKTPSSKQVAALFKRFENEAGPICERATVAIYGLQNDRIIKNRTGVLFRIADVTFVLTASHELKEMVDGKIPILVSWDGRKSPIPLIDAQFLTTEWESRVGHKDVVRDVAAIRLSDSCAKEIIAGGQSPLTLRDVCVEQDRSPAFFMMHGLPNAWFRVGLKGPTCQPLRYVAGIWPKDHSKAATIGYDPKVHLLLDLKRESFAPSLGRKVKLPGHSGIVGVSGCGIWRLCGEQQLTSWNADQCKLVAIQHRFYEEPGYIHTTWIQHALERIFLEYPELKKATSIMYRRLTRCDNFRTGVDAPPLIEYRHI